MRGEQHISREVEHAFDELAEARRRKRAINQATAGRFAATRLRYQRARGRNQRRSGR